MMGLTSNGNGAIAIRIESSFRRNFRPDISFLPRLRWQRWCTHPAWPTEACGKTTEPVPSSVSPLQREYPANIRLYTDTSWVFSLKGKKFLFLVMLQKWFLIVGGKLYFKVKMLQHWYSPSLGSKYIHMWSTILNTKEWNKNLIISQHPAVWSEQSWQSTNLQWNHNCTNQYMFKYNYDYLNQK